MPLLFSYVVRLRVMRSLIVPVALRIIHIEPPFRPCFPLDALLQPHSRCCLYCCGHLDIPTLFTILLSPLPLPPYVLRAAVVLDAPRPLFLCVLHIVLCCILSAAFPVF